MPVTYEQYGQFPQDSQEDPAVPASSWMEDQIRKQGIKKRQLLTNDRDPYAIYDRMEQTGAPSEVDRTAMRSLRTIGEATDMKRPASGGIIDGVYYAMPSKRSTVQQPEAVAALAQLSANRYLDKQMADKDALAKEAAAERAKASARDQAEWDDKQTIRKLQIAEAQRQVDAANKLRAGPTGVQGLMQSMGLSSEDPRIASARGTGDQSQVSQAEMAIAAEKKAKEDQAASFYEAMAKDTSQPPEVRAQYAKLAMKSRGQELDPSVYSGLERSARTNMPVADVVRNNPRVEEVIRNFVDNIGKYSTMGDPFTNADSTAADDKRKVYANAEFIAKQTGGNPNEIADYIFNEIASRSQTLPTSNKLGSALTLSGLVGTPREAYASALLGGRKQQSKTVEQ